jgi:hypothetical protein
MTDVPMISLLSDDELDAVTGGCCGGGGKLVTRICQNSRGGDRIVHAGRRGHSASARRGESVAKAGAGGAARSANGGDGGKNKIIAHRMG